MSIKILGIQRATHGEWQINKKELKMNRKDLQKVLTEAREKDHGQGLERERQRKELEARVETARKWFLENVLPKLRPTSVEDYLNWLVGYIKNGGKPTHVYDYPFARWDWYVAEADIEPIALYGAQSVEIIVPAGIKVGAGNWGHCALFYMDGYRATGLVPIFKDTNFPDQ